MTDRKKTTDSRRKLLKTVAAGGGAIIAGKTLPENWSKPAIDAISLPAHAQTSPTTFAGTRVAAIRGDSLFTKALDSLVSKAEAGPMVPAATSISYCIEPSEDGTMAKSVKVLVHRDLNPICSATLWSATDVPLNVQTGLNYNQGCSDFGAVNDWFEQLGLVNEATAASWAAWITLNKLSGSAAGTFSENQFGTDNEPFDIDPATCGPESVICNLQKCG